MESPHEYQNIYIQDNGISYRRETEPQNNCKEDSKTSSAQSAISTINGKLRIIFGVMVVFIIAALSLFSVQFYWISRLNIQNIDVMDETRNATSTLEINFMAAAEELKNESRNAARTSERNLMAAVNALEESLDTLKRNLTDVVTACPQASYFFPNIAQTTNYIRVTTPIPDLDEFTVCGLFKRFPNGDDFWVSYATMPGTSNNHNEYSISYMSGNIQISMNGRFFAIGSKLNESTEYHMCVTNFASDGLSNVYLDGDMAVVATTTSGTVDGAGSFIIGQDQDAIGGDFQSQQSFQGTLKNFMLWRRALKEEEIKEMYQNRCACPQDYLFTLERKNVEIFGGVTAVWPAEC